MCIQRVWFGMSIIPLAIVGRVPLCPISGVVGAANTLISGWKLPLLVSGTLWSSYGFLLGVCQGFVRLLGVFGLRPALAGFC